MIEVCVQDDHEDGRVEKSSAVSYLVEVSISNKVDRGIPVNIQSLAQFDMLLGRLAVKLPNGKFLRISGG